VKRLRVISGPFGWARVYLKLDEVGGNVTTGSTAFVRGKNGLNNLAVVDCVVMRGSGWQ
jgi:hypothetical protein